MSIDTRDRRASVLGVLKSYGFVLPNPNPIAEDQADRQQLAFSYRGILAGAYLPAYAAQFTYANAWIQPAMKSKQSIKALIEGSQIIIAHRLVARPSVAAALTYGPRMIRPALSAYAHVT